MISRLKFVGFGFGEASSGWKMSKHSLSLLLIARDKWHQCPPCVLLLTFASFCWLLLTFADVLCKENDSDWWKMSVALCISMFVFIFNVFSFSFSMCVHSPFQSVAGRCSFVLRDPCTHYRVNNAFTNFSNLQLNLELATVWPEFLSNFSPLFLHIFPLDRLH